MNEYNKFCIDCDKHYCIGASLPESILHEIHFEVKSSFGRMMRGQKGVSSDVGKNRLIVTTRQCHS